MNKQVYRRRYEKPLLAKPQTKLGRMNPQVH